MTVLREKRIGLTALGTALDVTPDSKASFVFTGQFDLCVIDGDRAIVLDAKTGRAEVAEAVDNPQVTALAVLVAMRYKVSHVRTAIVSPWCGSPTVSDFTLNALTLAKGWLLETLRNVEESTPADTKAGAWCKYCRAQFGCEAFKLAALNQVEKIDPMSIAGMDGKTQRSAMFARAMELSPESHVGAYRGLAIVKRYVDAIEGSFKQRVEAGEIPGFAIASKPGNREVTDAQLAFSALQPLNVTAEDMLAASSVAIGQLEEAVRKRSGIKSQNENRTVYHMTAKEAKDALNTALEAAGALGRKADKAEIIENTNLLEER